MRFPTRHRAFVASLLIALTVLALPAHAQSAESGDGVQQTLDRVDAFTKTTVFEMKFDVAATRPPDYTDLGLTATTNTACKVTPTGGMYCLDGNTVRNWPNPKIPGVYTDVMTCADTTLGLSGTPRCTGLTVDDTGAIWLAGRKQVYPSTNISRSTPPTYSYSLIRIVAKVGGVCPAENSPLASAPYCAKVYYSGRAELADLEAIDGETGSLYFPSCYECTPPARPGILAVERRKAVTFFPLAGGAVNVGDEPTWGITESSDEVQSVTLLTLNDGEDPYVLVATRFGRIKSKTAFGSTSVQVFSIPQDRTGSLCGGYNSDAANAYSIRASSKSGIVYVSDRNYCQVVALVTNSPAFAYLQYALDDAVTRRIRSTGAVPPLGLTLAAGIAITLSSCSGDDGCPILTLPNSTGPGNKIAARLLNVTLMPGSPAGVTFFQVKGIPDCRYAARDEFIEFHPELVQVCEDNLSAVIVDPYSIGIPAAQRLNVTPLLPVEVTSQFPNGLPPLLISRQHRGQLDNHFTFGAFFAVTAAGVQFKDTFEAQYDVPILEQRGFEGGCEPVPGDLLRWDVTSTVSEKVPSVGGEYVDMITNIGCINPTRTSGARLSLLPYNLEISPDTYGPTILHPFTSSLTVGNDAVFGRLLESMYKDMGQVLNSYGCPVLTSSQCRSLQVTYLLGKVKLDLCLVGAFLPKNVVNQALCSLFGSVLASFRSALPTTPAGDTANRTGELKTRAEVIKHVFETRFLPSIPVNGFCREKNLSSAACPNPWTTDPGS